MEEIKDEVDCLQSKLMNLGVSGLTDYTHSLSVFNRSDVYSKGTLNVYSLRT